MVIYRLLKEMDAKNYCLISSSGSANGNQNGYSGKLPADTFHLRPLSLFRRGGRFGFTKLRNLINIPLGLFQRTKQIAEIVRRERCEAIVACTGGPDLLDLPAGYFASRWTGVKFYPYIFDYYSYQWAGSNSWGRYESQFFPDKLEKLTLRGATEIIVPNEFLRDDLKRRHHVDSTIIRNPCDLSDYGLPTPHETIPKRGDFRIVYTGAVYEAHYDAFRNLIAALNLLNRPDVKLHLYTEQSRDALGSQGIKGPVVFHEHQALSAMPAIQQQADLLFLPLAFDSPYPEIVKTSAPGKTGEYLAAGTPVLVHAPADSFLIWYFREHGCGMVVEQRDPQQLAVAIARLLDEPELRNKLSQRARAQAEADFSIATAQAAFNRLMSL